MFIWTVKDVIAGLLIAAGLLCFVLYGLLVLADKIQRKFKAWRTRS